jgi:hypothetical protein
MFFMHRAVTSDMWRGKIGRFFITSLCLVALCAASRLSAQETVVPQLPPDTATTNALRDSIRTENEQLSLFQHLLEASTVDQRYLRHAHVKSWTVGNPAVRDSLFYALAEVDSSILSEAGTEAIVLATYSNDLIEIRFGTTVFKGLVLKEALKHSADKNLYKKIIDSYEYSRDIELRDLAAKISTPIEPEMMTTDRTLQIFNPVLPNFTNPHPINGLAELSLNELVFKIGPMWGGELRIGNDMLNSPFWSAGTYAVLASYNRFKVGFLFPLGAGRSTAELISPFILWARKLDGARGMMGEFDLGPIGGFFALSRFNTSDVDLVTNPDKIFTIGAAAIGYYSFAVSLNATNMARAKAGFGVLRVDQGRVTPVTVKGVEDVLYESDQDSYYSPYVKFEYLNKDVTSRYEASIQFFDMTMLFSGSMEVVRNILYLDAKYVWPLGAQLRPWQNPGFFIISPKIHIVF